MKVKSSYIWAGAIVLGLGAWLGSKPLLSEADTAQADGEPPAAASPPEAEALQAVRVAVFEEEQRPSWLVLRGRTEAARRVEVRSETTGTVLATPPDKGQVVSAGDVLCQLDMADREAQLLQARAALASAESKFEAASRLGDKGFSARNSVTEEQARLDAALAAMKRAEIEVGRTRITAPFTGVVEERHAEVGSYVGTGGPCATLVDLDPIKLVAHVSERDLAQLRSDATAEARLATGQELEGRLTFVGSTADPATRTFRVEIEAPNADLSVKDGVTAEISIPLKPVTAHRLSPALLTLDDTGTIGVRIVDARDIVGFVPVQIVASGQDGVWVSGLPPKPVVITVGHEYVTAGQKVRRVEDTRTATAESGR